MRFALVNNERVEAKLELKNGLCPGCLQPVIARCGKQRIHYWAHHTKKVCDNWWESETEWHRSWKNNFPADWQEVFLPDEQTGEKHIADVRTSHGLVIEFQHSHIAPQERESREKFYRDMVWIVDGTRLKRDYPRFRRGKDDYFRPMNVQGFFLVDFPNECFPSDWITSSVPVIFDFGNLALTEQENAAQEPLWCLLPRRAGRYAVVVAISRKDFITSVQNRLHLFQEPAADIVNRLNAEIIRHNEYSRIIQQRQVTIHPPRRRNRKWHL